MADIDAAPMHEDFPRWYGAVSLDDDQARRQARWEGVSSIVGDADRNTVEGLLRLAHGSRQKPAGDVVEAVRQAFKATDDRFRDEWQRPGNPDSRGSLPCRPNGDADEGVGAAAALYGEHSCDSGGARHPNLSMDLGVHWRRQAIVRRGEANRKRPSFEKPLVYPEVGF